MGKNKSFNVGGWYIETGNTGRSVQGRALRNFKFSKIHIRKGEANMTSGYILKVAEKKLNNGMIINNCQKNYKKITFLETERGLFIFDEYIGFGNGKL